MILMSWEECGMVAEPCLDAGTNPLTSEVTYQVIYENVARPLDARRDGVAGISPSLKVGGLTRVLMWRAVAGGAGVDFIREQRVNQ